MQDSQPPQPSQPAVGAASSPKDIVPAAGTLRKSWPLAAKSVAALFATIIAPLIVALILKHFERDAAPAPQENRSAVNTGGAPTGTAPSGGAPVDKAPLAADAPKPLIAPFDAAEARAGQEAWAKYIGTTVEQVNSAGMSLVLIPPGEYLMGSTPEQLEAAWKMLKAVRNAESMDREMQKARQQRVTFERPFWLGMTEVTIQQFRKFVDATGFVTEAEQYGFGNSDDKTLSDEVSPAMQKMTWRTPGPPVTDDSPVTQVTWNDAVQFCNWLSEQEKLKACYRYDTKQGWALLPVADGYRLPTEAEWEYACRAGSTTLFSFGDDPSLAYAYGWFIRNSGKGARVVGLKSPNAFGLFDMHGNVSELCHGLNADNAELSATKLNSAATNTRRLHCGGDWNSQNYYARSALHKRAGPAIRQDTIGFRVLRVRISDGPAVVP